MCRFDYFEKIEIVEKVNATNHEYFLLGDINVFLMPGVTSVNGNKLNDIFEMFGLKQLIVDPTRPTPYSSTLIDLCVTNQLHHNLLPLLIFVLQTLHQRS